MSTHNIGFYEDLTKIIFAIIIKYHQLRTLFLLLSSNQYPHTISDLSQTKKNIPFFFHLKLTIFTALKIAASK